MNLSALLRRYWPEALLALALAVPWLSLLVLGGVWLWQHRYAWVWAIAAAALSLTAWALFRLVRRRASLEETVREPLGEDLGDIAEPSPDWAKREREVWQKVLAVAKATPPFALPPEIEPLIVSARQTVIAVARDYHGQHDQAWTEFTLPEALLLTERVSQRLRGKVLSIPFVRQVKIGRVVRAVQVIERYGPLGRWVYGVWRLGRLAYDPLTATAREINALTDDRSSQALLDWARVRMTHAFVLEVGRAAIDLYSGRLVLSQEELREAAAADAAAPEPLAPVRLLLAGQVNVGKSSLVNALAHEVRCAAGPLPTTSRATEYRLDVDGLPAVSIVDTPGLGEDSAREVLAQAGRSDLIVWVASATQPARDPDRHGLDEFRAWANAQLQRRQPNVILALTHIDELRPANEWTPPYDVAAPAGPKARAIRAAMDAVASALALPPAAIVPVAMPPSRELYNIDALWSRIAVELPQAKLVQLDRLRPGGRRMNLRELAGQLGDAGRFVLERIAKA